MDGYTITPCEKETVGTDVIMKLKADTEDEEYSRFLEEYEIRDREAAAGCYSAAFQGKFVLPPVEQDSQHSWYQYTLLAADTAQRERLIAHLKERGIPTNLYYPTPMHMLPVFRALETYGETYPNAVEYCDRTISIPMHPYLEESVQEEIVKAVLETL